MAFLGILYKMDALFWDKVLFKTASTHLCRSSSVYFLVLLAKSNSSLFGLFGDSIKISRKIWNVSKNAMIFFRRRKEFSCFYLKFLLILMCSVGQKKLVTKIIYCIPLSFLSLPLSSSSKHSMLRYSVSISVSDSSSCFTSSRDSEKY